jgi:hypothetical protein
LETGVVKGRSARNQADWRGGGRLIIRRLTQGFAPARHVYAGSGGWPGNHFLFRWLLLEKRKNHLTRGDCG